MQLLDGALDDSALVVVAVYAEEEGDGVVHGLVSYDAVSEGAHFVMPRLAADVLCAFIVKGHAMVDAVGFPQGQGQFKSTPHSVFGLLSAPLGDHEKDVGLLFIGEGRDTAPELCIVNDDV